MVHHPAQLHWIRPPRQQRTHQGLERILDVAERLLLEKCFDDIHVREIALRADTSVAAFYRRFKDKDGLLHALHERRCKEAFETADDAFDADRWLGADIEEILHTIFPFLIEVMQPNESLYRAIYQRAITDDLMRERAMKLNRYVVSGLSDLLMARKDEIRHPHPAAAISFALTQVVALLTQQYTVGIRDLGPVSFRDGAIASELTRSCLAYLGVLGATKVDTSPRSTAGTPALSFTSSTNVSIEGEQP
ncbi:MAG: TetR/AcrR family transcriptional regulator [Myxococcales bacterium]|nr:TetR/AcrR family transcriptional regulator [Myxococcales bacterium]HIK83854.1 TetR/AcrR family transcriptional regulator [Myxococcales bacterium]